MRPRRKILVSNSNPAPEAQRGGARKDICYITFEKIENPELMMNWE